MRNISKILLAFLYCIYFDSINVSAKEEKVQDAKKNAEKEKAQPIDSVFHITVLTAANFNFTGKLSSTFLGVFNVFAPHLYDKKFGLNFGIEKVNYSSGDINGNDSNQVEYKTQYYLLNPLDVNHSLNTINAGAKYVSQYNQFTFSATNTVWSFYFQPNIKISSFDESHPDEGLYIHLHTELLNNQWTRTANIKNLYQSKDTGIAGNVTSSNGFYWVNPNGKIVSSDNFISTYIGFGATIYLNLYSGTKPSYFFAQGSYGVAFNTPNFHVLNDPTITLNPNGTYSVNTLINSEAMNFILFKALFIQTLGSNSQLTIGFDTRALIKSPLPQYAVYLGVNVDLLALSKLIVN